MTAWGRSSCILLEAFLEGGEEGEGGDRSQVVDVGLAQLLQDELLGRGEEEHLALSGALPLVAGQDGRALHVELLLFKVGKDLAGAARHLLRKPRELGHV